MGSMAKLLLIITIIMALSLPVLSTNSKSGRPFPESDYFEPEPEPEAITLTYLDDNTVRVDPLDGFKKYRGGFDITNVNYWSSTAFTGIYGYSMAVLWLLCGVGYGIFLLVRNCCFKKRNLKRRGPCNRNHCYFHPLLLAIFLSLLTIVGVGLVLGGNARFHSRAKRVIDIIIDTAEDASETIYRTTGALKEISISLEDVNGDPEATSFLISTSESLDSQAAEIAAQASKNRRLIDKGLKIVYIVTTVIISFTLVAVIALSTLGILRFQKTVQVLIAICWIFTVLCLFFFGIYFFLQNFSEDTCTAFGSFEKDPYNNSLTKILPCDELLSAKSVLDEVSAGIYDLVNEVNHNISTSYGNVFQICNPFSPPPSHEYQPSTCPSSSIKIGDVPRVLRLLVCPDSGGQTCNGGILVPAALYDTIEAYTTSIQKLLDVYPDMDSLVECKTVERAFSDILEKHCGPLKRNVRLLWASLLFLSLVMVALVLVWSEGTYHQQTHPSFGVSIKPEVVTPHIMESGAVQPVQPDSKQSMSMEEV